MRPPWDWCSILVRKIEQVIQCAGRFTLLQAAPPRVWLSSAKGGFYRGLQPIRLCLQLLTQSIDFMYWIGTQIVHANGNIFRQH